MKLNIQIGVVLAFLLIVSCANSSNTNLNDPNAPNDPSRNSYNDSAENIYRDVLVECSTSKVCPLSELPFLGMQDQEVTINDLKSRLIVSHQWMGDRFFEALELLDAETLDIVLQLSRSLTSITISYDVRPSYYTRTRSAIYLDPRNLALTAQELATIDLTPDYRSDFGAAFSFVGAWRYVNAKNDYLYTSDINTRNLQDVSFSLTRLLFHELAHANDFYPHDLINGIDCATTSDCQVKKPYNLLSSSSFLSSDFQHTTEEQSMMNPDYRLRNSNLYDYAKVRYRGATILDAQRNWTADQMGMWMSSSGAVHDYAYLTQYEDVAMITEAILTRYLFDGHMDIAYLNKQPVVSEDGTPLLDNLGNPILQTTSSSPVTWGVRNRIAAPEVTRRAKHLLEIMLPGKIPNDFYTDLANESPEMFQTACGWRDNLDLACDNPALTTKGITTRDDRNAEVLTYDILSPHDR